MGRGNVVNANQPSVRFSQWLEHNFHLDNFSTAVITRKAEETFLSTKKKPMPEVADLLLAKATKWGS